MAPHTPAGAAASAAKPADTAAGHRAAEPGAGPGAASIWRQHNYLRYLGSRVLATLALQIQTVAIGWQVYQASGRVLDLALVGLFQFVPMLALVLVAGQVADRCDRRRILLVCLALYGACSLALWMLALAAPAAGPAWPVFAILTLIGATRAFMTPATQSMLTGLVPPEHLKRAVALGSSGFHLAATAGPALGGLLCLAGTGVAYGVAAALFGAALLLVGLTRMRAAQRAPQAVQWQAVFDGVRFVARSPLILGALALDLFAVLLGAATALLPAYAHDVLRAGPDSLGWLRMGVGLGALGSAALLACRPVARRAGHWMFGGVMVYGLGCVGLALSTSFGAALTALVAIGAGDMVSVYVRQILLQLGTPDELRGRVNAVNSVFIGASNELGMVQAGLSAQWLGIERAMLAGGLATLAVTALLAQRLPALRRLDRFPTAPASHCARP